MKDNNMELICRITDEDIGERTINMENPKLRLGARGIVIREDGKIAVFNKSNKNEYKLPGGGLEGNEKPEEAFKREVLEETGCEVKIIECLGTTEEYKTLNNFKQISYVFVGKVLKDTQQLNVTEKEKDEGAKMLWETPEKALELITECFGKLTASKYSSIYSTKFVVLRDRLILERYLGKKDDGQLKLWNELNENNTVQEVQKYIKKVIEIRGFADQKIEKTMLLLLEEVGELAKSIRKNATNMRIDNDKINHYDTIESEIADVFIVLSSICNKLGIDLFKSIKDKEENIKRTWK